jgi:hypothetical protein
MGHRSRGNNLYPNTSSYSRGKVFDTSPFDGVNPSLGTIQRLFLDEVECWCMAGAKQIESLGLLAAFARGARAFPSA